MSGSKFFRGADSASTSSSSPAAPSPVGVGQIFISPDVVKTVEKVSNQETKDALMVLANELEIVISQQAELKDSFNSLQESFNSLQEKLTEEIKSLGLRINAVFGANKTDIAVGFEKSVKEYLGFKYQQALFFHSYDFEKHQGYEEFDVYGIANEMHILGECTLCLNDHKKVLQCARKRDNLVKWEDRITDSSQVHAYVFSLNVAEDQLAAITSVASEKNITLVIFSKL